MLNAFSTIRSAASAPPSAVDFSGKWKNDLGSEMDLNVDSTGMLSGVYRTAVGSPSSQETFALVGFSSGDLISFTVNFGKYGSITCWSGQHTTNSGAESIKTMWLLARNVTDVDEPENLWGAVLTGANSFHRVAQPDQVQISILPGWL